jgi:DNA mismatch endonuclease (patch repair protein)
MKNPLPLFRKPNVTRSSNMRAIKSKGNRSTEWRLRSMLVRQKIKGWTMHNREIIGSPDFAFPAKRIAIFIDGCFWHGCPLCGHKPKTNREYWTAKLARNINRDKTNTLRLRKQGFKVIRIWECALKENPTLYLQRIRESLVSSKRNGS